MHPIGRRLYAISLSHHTDRFMGILGIASSMQILTRDRFVYGLWEKSLLRDLLWYIAPSPKVSNTRFETPIAPSWSWVAVTAPAQYPEQLENVMWPAEIVDYELRGTNSCFTGLLTISGPSIVIEEPEWRVSPFFACHLEETIKPFIKLWLLEIARTRSTDKRSEMPLLGKESFSLILVSQPKSSLFPRIGLIGMSCVMEFGNMLSLLRPNELRHVEESWRRFMITWTATSGRGRAWEQAVRTFIIE